MPSGDTVDSHTGVPPRRLGDTFEHPDLPDALEANS
jgi:hypothetical protein